MDSAWQILGTLLGASLGASLLIAVAVMAPGRRRPGGGAEPVWMGGPSGAEHGVGSSDLVLMDHPPAWAATRGTDWRVAAETAEPGRHVGGASAGW
ncbi:hypothetical protein [Nonomuraea longicatena]|uniref:Uncharacterized protein n=1 Tax=Nonomuraea longicatena TaxID=83682 RepID=A0ABN1NR39_9ACTN